MVWEWAKPFRESEVVPPWFPFFSFSCVLLYGFTLSLLQAIVFSRMGAQIDRPLWKYNALKDVLKRFLVPWLILNLVVSVLGQFLNSSAEANNVAAQSTCLFILMLLHIVAIPVVAAVMYHGSLNWNELSTILRPISRLFQMSLLVFFIGFLQFTFNMSFLMDKRYADDILFRLAVNAPLVFLDCFAFAAMWLVCMTHRDMVVAGEFDDDSDDFDY
jgi:hypothetical protein